jgi:hypothetical protein
MEWKVDFIDEGQGAVSRLRFYLMEIGIEWMD